MDKILKVAKRLKAFTLNDIVMFCEIDAETAEKILHESASYKLRNLPFLIFNNFL